MVGDSVERLRRDLRAFVEERDWDQFHSPKNLAMALSVEVAEIVEHFQWVGDADSRVQSKDFTRQVGSEIGDVLIYLLLLCDKLELDPITEATQKLEANRRKYPADRVRGSAKKYTDYP